MNDLLALSGGVLDRLSDGVYITDTQRRIVFWSRAAERITGWRAEEVVGRRCLENILCHIDKDGHLLCGEEYCPLHRCMVTGKASDYPLIIFAHGSRGQRIPMQVTVAPVRDDAGRVVGAVEQFHDASETFHELERARRIQRLTLEHDLPADPRIQVSSFYVPYDIVGGDYYAIRRLDADRYGFLLADVMGHGFGAALYTMYLSALWTRHHALLTDPAAFARTLNHELCQIVKDESFTPAACGLIDVRERTLELTSAGGPPVLLAHADGTMDQLGAFGWPLGMTERAAFEVRTARLRRGDSLLLFSDGAIEVHNAQGEMLGVEGLVRILQGHGYPASPFPSEAVEEELLKFSNAIRLEDDLTFLEVRLLQ